MLMFKLICNENFLETTHVIKISIIYGKKFQLIKLTFFIK